MSNDEATGRHDRRALIPRPATVATRRPFRSRPDMGEAVDPGAVATWLEGKVAFLESHFDRLHSQHEDGIQALRTDIAALRGAVSRVESHLTNLSAVTSHLVDTVGTSPNDATGSAGRGIAGQVAAIVVANKHAVRAGAITGGSVVGAVQLVIFIVQKLAEVFR